MYRYSYFVILTVLGVFTPVLYTQAETILSFDARIVVLENASIEVTERIVYDFGNAEEKHGIYRHIPYSYQAGTETYTADVISVFVTDEQGRPRPFQESRGGGELTLKIGDPNITVKGEHTYDISYVVKGPFLYFDDYDELFWNVTGYWPRSIVSAGVLVDLPVGVQVLEAACYKGRGGSRTRCDYDEKLVSAERAGYTARAQNLKNEEGLSIAVAFPKGVIAEIEQPWTKNIIPFDIVFLPFSVPVGVLIFMIGLWYRRGRDPEGRSVIVTEFEPPEGIVPSVAGFVLSEMVQAELITAEIVRLAVEGHIKIHRYEDKVLLFNRKDFLIERVGEEVPNDAVLQKVLEKLFQSEFEETIEINGNQVSGVTLSKMKNKFTKEKREIANVVRSEGMDKKLFREHPNKTRGKYAAIAGAIFAIGVSIGSSVGEGLIKNVGLALVASAFFVGVFAFIMPAKTIEGVRVKQHLKGFKRYLKKAEKRRIAFHDSPHRESNAPEKTIDIFNKFLPYAIVLDVEKEWAEQFEGIFTEEPHWYHSSTGEAFSIGALSGSLSDFSKSVSTASAPRSSGSGGGGSVGGGFGGGGGGSW